MSDQKVLRLSKVARDFNVGIATIIDFLHIKGIQIDSNPNAKITQDIYEILLKEYSSDSNIKKESAKINLDQFKPEKRIISLKDIEADKKTHIDAEEPIDDSHITLVDRVKADVKVIGKIDLNEARKTKITNEPAAPIEDDPIEDEVISISTEDFKDEIIETLDEELPEFEDVLDSEDIIAETESDTETSVIDPIEKTKDDSQIKVVGHIDLSLLNQKTRPAKKTKEEKDAERKKEQRLRQPQPAQPRQDDRPRNNDRPDNRPDNRPNDRPDNRPDNRQGNRPFDRPNDRPNDRPAGDRPFDNRQRPPFNQDRDSVKKRPPVENYRPEVDRLQAPKVIGNIDLNVLPIVESENDKREKRKRIVKDKNRVDIKKEIPAKGIIEDRDANKNKFVKKGKAKTLPNVISEDEVDATIKDTLARMSGKGVKSKAAKYRKDKRDQASIRQMEEETRRSEESKIIRTTEFISANELASMMDVPVTDVISACMSLGLFVSINQRIDAETISIVAEEFGFSVEFTTVELQEAIEEDEEDSPEDLLPRSPVVTVMGHVDHGKTKLLDYIRSANVIAGEAGGITQHIGAYSVKLEKGHTITFLDTPGHEAFTAMRARGASVTDIAIIVVAADDGVMPQTKEAINHAKAAGVPLIFAINKIDKPAANANKVREELAAMDYLVEEWGGKYQSQEISAKSGLNINLLLDKVLLEAEMLDLKANPEKNAQGVIIESALDKGKGFVSTVLVQAGTLKVGDMLLAGTSYGRIKAMYNERNQRVNEAGPSTPVIILGLNNAPQAGDKFSVLDDEREAKDIAVKREQLKREQGLRTKKHITLDEIGRRLAIGNFKELNVIVKGDVDGSVEALADSLIKLSNNEIVVNIVHKAVGQISESDVLLAAASNAVIIAFQVRPSIAARKLAEKEEIDIRMYSIIYDAIDELKKAIEGMLAPEIREEIIGMAEILEVFKITKVGTIAGCMVMEGKITRDLKVRVIRDGIVIHTGKLGSLKRFKDDVKEVTLGQDCGLNLDNFNDMKKGDHIEVYRETEIKKTL